jgi:hypothetical protein
MTDEYPRSARIRDLEQLADHHDERVAAVAERLLDRERGT